MADLAIVITKQLAGDRARRISLFRAALELESRGYSKDLANRLMSEAYNTITFGDGTVYETTEAQPRGDR